MDKSSHQNPKTIFLFAIELFLLEVGNGTLKDSRNL